MGKRKEGRGGEASGSSRSREASLLSLRGRWGVGRGREVGAQLLKGELPAGCFCLETALFFTSLSTDRLLSLNESRVGEVFVLYLPGAGKLPGRYTFE